MQLYLYYTDKSLEMNPRQPMIPDRKWSPNWTANDPRTVSDPRSGPQMIALKKRRTAWSFSDRKVKILTKNPKRKNFLLISEIKHFKDPTPQWHKKAKMISFKIYIYIHMHTQISWMDVLPLTFLRPLFFRPVPTFPIAPLSAPGSPRMGWTTESETVETSRESHRPPGRGDWHPALKSKVT